MAELTIAVLVASFVGMLTGGFLGAAIERGRWRPKPTRFERIMAQAWSGKDDIASARGEMWRTRRGHAKKSQSAQDVIREVITMLQSLDDGDSDSVCLTLRVRQTGSRRPAKAKPSARSRPESKRAAGQNSILDRYGEPAMPDSGTEQQGTAHNLQDVPPPVS